MALTPNGIIIKAPRCDRTNEYGLLSAANILTGVDPHWASSGFELEEQLCGSGVVSFVSECPPATGFTKPADRSVEYCHVDPFEVVGSYKCPPIGQPGVSGADAFEIARQRLLRWEGFAVEETFWTGVVSNGSGFVSPSLAFGNPDCDITPVDVSSGGAVDPVAAISLLEGALGDTTGCGVIHAPYELGAYLANFLLLVKEGDAYYTPTGFRVVLGHGYPGTGPSNAAAAADEMWIFGTGPISVLQSNVLQLPENIAEGVNRQVNDLEIRAERTYAVGFSCALFAVRVSLCSLCP